MPKEGLLHVMTCYHPNDMKVETCYLPCNKTFYNAYTSGHCVGSMVVVRTSIDRRNSSKVYAHDFNLDGANFRLYVFADGINDSCKGYISLFVQRLSKEQDNRHFDMTFEYGAKHSTTFNLSSFPNNQNHGVECWKHWNDIKGDIAKITLAMRASENVKDIVSEVVAIKLDDKGTPEDDLLGRLTLSKMDDHVSSAHYDVVIKGDGWQLFTHKQVLSTNSPVFRQMFHHDTPERNNSEIEIVDFEAPVVKALIHFMNTGRLYYSNIATILDILRAAEKYLMDDLKSSCEQLLCFHINKDNLADLAIAAVNLRLNILKGTCIYLMKIYFSKLALTTDWEKIVSDPETVLCFTRSLAYTMNRNNWSINKHSSIRLYDDEDISPTINMQ